jgi:putative ABC transport system permease protein
MAWRDSRRTRLRLLLFSASVMAGIAALVTIGSLRDSLLQALENESRAMLGADVYLHAKRPVSDKAEALLREHPCEVKREVAFTTMIQKPGAEESRLVQARAVEDAWPFFGKPVTAPPDAWARCLAGEGFVADPALAEQMGLQPGSALKLSALELPLLGTLVQPPPQVSLMTAFAPEIFFAHRLVEGSGLDPASGLTFHRLWLKFPDGFEVDKKFAETARKPLRTEGFSMETVSARKRTVRTVLDKVYSFLSLMAFIALVLGGLGVASALHVHAAERLPAVATLRCMGCTPSRALAVYVIQGIWLGIAGSTGGVLLGAGAVAAAPWVLRQFIPIEATAHLSLPTVGQSLIFGFLLCVSFALLPLLRVRRVPALAAVRARVSGGGSLWSDPAAWLLLPLVAGTLVWLAVSISPPDARSVGVGFCIALAAGLLLLAAVAQLLMKLARKVSRPWWPYTLRQGLAGLYRPGNQTLLFLLSTGTGVALILSTLLTQSMLTSWLSSKQLSGKANFFIIDIKDDKRLAVAETLRDNDAEPLGEAPISLFTLRQVNGKSLDQLQNNKERDRPRGWFLTHVYRTSWDPKLPVAAAGEPLEVSLEKNLAEGLKVKTGDTVTFANNGHELQCSVVALHDSSWERMLDNFPVLLRSRVPEDLAVTWATAARISDAAHAARLQRAVSAAVPGVTVFDVAAMAAVLEEMIDRGLWLVRALSLLTVITGLVIVAAVLLAGRRDRVAESVLLRTLGASRQQIRRILMWEYVLMGFFAALTGGILSVGAAWLLATRAFEIPFDVPIWPLSAAIGIVSLITSLLGLALSRGVASHPPLAILRGQG